MKRSLFPSLLAAAWAVLPTFGSAADTAPQGGDAVLTVYVQAAGGSENLARIQSRVTQSKLSVGWLSAHLFRRKEDVHDDRGVAGAERCGGADRDAGAVGKL